SEIRARLYAPDEEAAPVARAPVGILQSEGAELTFERTSTSISLVALGVALLVGVAIGFAGGYALGGRRPASVPVAVQTPRTAVPGGREYTESPVKEPAASPKLPPGRPGSEGATPDDSKGVRLKPDTTREVRPKPETTNVA